MTTQVVDPLEAVEVAVQHRHVLADPLRTGECAAEPVGQEQPIRQAGENVMQGGMAEPLLGGHDIRDVAQHTEDLDGATVGRALERREPARQPPLATRGILDPVTDLHDLVVRQGTAGAQCILQQRTVLGMDADSEVLHLGREVPSRPHQLPRRPGPADRPPGGQVVDDDRVGRGGQHCGREFLGSFGALPLADQLGNVRRHPGGRVDHPGAVAERELHRLVRALLRPGPGPLLQPVGTCPGPSVVDPPRRRSLGVQPGVVPAEQVMLGDGERLEERPVRQEVAAVEVLCVDQRRAVGHDAVQHRDGSAQLVGE